MAVATYTGKIQNGKVELANPVSLPEGSEVYVVIPDKLMLRAAKRKANGWLLSYVGNLLMADNGVLVQNEIDWLWRFDVYITASNHEPWGPIGCVNVNATTGQIVDASLTKEALMNNGRNFKRPL